MPTVAAATSEAAIQLTWTFATSLKLSDGAALKYAAVRFDGSSGLERALRKLDGLPIG